MPEVVAEEHKTQVVLEEQEVLEEEAMLVQL
jgi:hypothetical protein